MSDPYDVLTIAAVADELSATVGGGRIQRIGLIDGRTIGVEIYAGGQRHHVVASADDRSPRLRLTPAMPSLDPALVTPFGLLLRKYVRGGVILGIDQPPLERLVRLSIAKRLPPDGPESAIAHDREDPEDSGEDDDDLGEGDVPIRHVALYVELMGRRSNLILVDDDGRIMESAKRVTTAMSRVRQVLPRLPYLPPPPPDRLDPRLITPDSAAQFLASLPAEADLARALVDRFRGLSPLMAREIVFRAGGDNAEAPIGARDVAADALARETLALLEPLRTMNWRPRVYQEGEDIVAVASIPMRHLAARYEELAVDSISAALALGESPAAAPSPVRHAQRRQRLLDAVNAEREKAQRRLAALASERSRAEAAERLRQSGELIYASLWQIAPGQSELVVEDLTIPLDPHLSASENAQAYFERYRKAQSASAQLPVREEETAAEIAYFEQLATLIAQAPGFAELEALAAEWAERSSPPSGSKPRRKSAARRPKALVDAEGNTVYVGRSGLQNDLVTFDIASPDDTWLHARGVPGSHVVIRWRIPGTAEDPRTVEAAAALAAWYSAARESGAVEVDVAQRRHVRKIKGGGPGMVTYRHERTIRVEPAPEERLREVLSDR